MKIFTLLPLLFLCSLLYAQDEESSNERLGVFQGSEVGVDLAFSASTNGGNVGLGLKYGAKLGKYFIVGPSARYDLTWIKNQVGGQNGSYHVVGGGAFVHARFLNALFLGAEFEYLKSPYAVNGTLTGIGTWSPSLFLGGGFSMEFNEVVRLNAGIMYDVINSLNSPFRNSYSITRKDANGNIVGYLPIIYRLAFFIPIG